MTENLAQPTGTEMPDIPGPDLFGAEALDQLAENGLNKSMRSLRGATRGRSE